MSEMQTEDENIERFKALYTKYAPALIAYAARFVDTGTAEDLVQDIFLKVWDKRAFIFLKEGIHTYLYQAVKHACLDHFKHEDVKADYASAILTKLKIEELYYTDDPDFIYHQDDRMLSIQKEIEKLPEKRREIFTMAYLEEKKSEEIALCLNLSKRTVEAQLYKALKNLRDALVSCKKNT
ncbi:MAG: RNA polymerase sigma-70 factor [Tannerella sp.]|nr:RNA polymerase sigma-70 factor [Tannerella sp.]